METSTEAASELAKRIITQYLPNTTGAVKESKTITLPIETEEGYNSFLKNKITVLLYMTLVLTKLLPQWRRIDILADEVVKKPGSEPGPFAEAVINIKLFNK